MMEIPEGKVSLLDAVPVRCGHITTEWEGECAVLAYPRFKYEWMRRFLLPKGMSPDIHVRLEEHGTAVWNLIDGHRTVREIISLLARISSSGIACKIPSGFVRTSLYSGY